ncbi:MAG: hypothetical protein ABL963_16470 [Longimicrobiales bacterium]
MNDEKIHPIDPLPRDWLPEALAPESHAVWDASTARVLASAEREWSIRASGVPGVASWLSEMGGWLRPVAMLAAAAVVLALVLTDRPTLMAPSQAADAMALQLVASGGEPFALWAALGVPADPVLALLALDDHSAFAVPERATEPVQGDPR